MLALIGEFVRKLGVSLIKKLVLDEYESRKEQLMSKLSNKYVYLKMDAYTHHHVNFFDIYNFID